MSKPDRQDDGLRTCLEWLDRKGGLGERRHERIRRALAAPSDTVWEARLIETCAKIAEPWQGFWLDKDSTDADRAVVAVRTEIANKIRALNAPPSRDGAEGAGDGTRLVGGIVAFEVVGDDLNSMAGFTRDEGIADIWRQGGLTVRPLFGAPPKPAPDAMQTALAAKIEKAWRWEHRTSVGHFVESLATDEQATIVAALRSAPVPPADGALLSKLIQCPKCLWWSNDPQHEQTCQLSNSAERFKASHQPRMSAPGERDPSVMPDCRSAETALPRSLKSADDWRGVLWRERLRSELHISSDLDHRSWRDIKRALESLAASPSPAVAAEPEPVGEIQRQFYEWWEVNQVDPAHGMITQNCALATWHAAYNKYVRGCRSPVQPGAGEREATLHECANIAKFGAKKCNDGDTDWHKGFHYAANATALEIEGAILALSRQAPHSSREGGR